LHYRQETKIVTKRKRQKGFRGRKEDSTGLGPLSWAGEEDWKID
jgi:hypothetical protein